jgi:heptosyltransferase-2
MRLKLDCIHFPGDRPCKPHKETGVHCDECVLYKPRAERILIIKLDAVGDVLRTTCILGALKEKYPDAEIVWVTLKGAMPLFENNPYIQRLLDYEAAETQMFLQTAHFTLSLNLDASARSSRMQSFVKATQKIGYAMNERGFVYPLNPEAEAWLEMGAFDDLKRQNKKTYQQVVYEICRLPVDRIHEIVMRLSDSEKQFAENLKSVWGINGKTIIGLNTGSSPRWVTKQWSVQGYKDLIEQLSPRNDVAILLLGGSFERERNAELIQHAKHLGAETVIDTGTENTLREFFAILSICDVVVTGDTLAMHAAVALEKKVVVIFGSTSSAEIDLYGRGVKIEHEEGCKCYYLPKCREAVSCTEKISASRVLQAVNELWTRSR